MSYTITEPYAGTPEAKEGNLPFFYVKDENQQVVYYAVTYGECEKWILEHS
jgi:hypothetical protein